jgi:fimbrial chaperone protein
MLRRFAVPVALLAWLPGLLLAQGAPGQIGVSPPVQIVALDGPAQTHATRLHNMGQAPVRVRVGAASWTLDADGRQVELPPAPESLEQWLVVNPTELDIPPGETRAVRFAFRPALPVAPGEHRVALIFEQIDHPEETPPGEGTGMVFRTRFRISSAIYATVGAIERRGRIEAVGLAPDALTVTLASEGNGHARLAGRYALAPAAAFASAEAARALLGETPAGALAQGELSAVPVLPGTSRTVAQPLGEARLAPGRYWVALSGSLGETPVARVALVELPAR